MPATCRRLEAAGRSQDPIRIGVLRDDTIFSATNRCVNWMPARCGWASLRRLLSVGLCQAGRPEMFLDCEGSSSCCILFSALMDTPDARHSTRKDSALPSVCSRPCPKGIPIFG